MSKKKYKGKFSTAASSDMHKIHVILLSFLLVVSLVILGILEYRRNNASIEEVPVLSSTGSENTTADVYGTTDSTTQPTTAPTTAATTETTQPLETTQSATVATTESTTESTTETTQPLATTQSTTVATTEPTTEPNIEPTTGPTKPPAPPPSDPPPTIPPVIDPPKVPEKVVITLPYVIPGSNLVIQRVAPYDGVYLEDGSDAAVTDVAMVLLYNAGSEAVEYAKITMKYDDKILQFEASAIPAEGIVVAQALGKNSCAAGDLLECTADVATMPTLDKAEDQIKIEDNGNNSLTVTNLTDKDIATVRIFYKYYMEDTHAYVGGITYTAKISNLKANESIVITPSHYASGASEVMMVRTYDEDI